MLAEPAAVDALVSALRTDATPIAAAAALALGWLGDAGAAEALAEAAFAPDPRLRRAALAGLGRPCGYRRCACWPAWRWRPRVRRSSRRSMMPTRRCAAGRSSNCVHAPTCRWRP